MLLTIAVFAPLAGAVVAGLFGKVIGDRLAELVAILGMVVSALCGVLAMLHIGFGARRRAWYGSPNG